MADPIATVDPTAFLAGGGVAGALIARHDWEPTVLGAPKTWPASLKTVMAMVLRCPEPMAVLWGPDGVMIYNNAYAAFIGDAHPGLLGSKVREAFPRAAAFMDKMMRAVLSGESLAIRDRELTLARRGRAEPVWMNITYSPILGDDAEPAGVLVLVTDTTQRVEAELKAAAETSRQRRMFTQAPGFISILWGPEHVFEFVNNTHRRLFGGTVEGKAFRKAFPLLRRLPKVLDQVYETGERYTAHAERVMAPVDNPINELFVDFVLEPITDDDGRVRGVFCEGFDVTNEVRARKAADETQARLSAAFDVARLGSHEWDLATMTPVMDARAREIFGFTSDEPLTLESYISRMDPDDLARHAAVWPGPTQRRQLEYRIHLPSGATRHVVSISDVVPGPDGRLNRVVGVIADVTERKRAEERQRLLINELNHRVKNTLATVQSIAAHTLRAARDAASARDAFEARLMALAATHDLLTSESWHGAWMADVVDAAAAPFQSDRRRQIRHSGPAVWLAAQRALALSMALHELATNAVKYGALSLPAGHVAVRWRKTRDGDLALSWTEQDGPPVQPPTHTGFGSRLLERGLARELGGEVDFQLKPDGARCEIRFPLEDPNQASAPEPAAPI